MNLNLLAPINLLSYGIVSTNILIELQKLGVDVALFPIGSIEAQEKHHNGIRQALVSAQKPDFQAPSLRIYHEFSLAEHVGYGTKIGFPIFERNKFNEQMKHHLVNQDELFTCSCWGKQIILDNLIAKQNSIHVIPLGIDPTIFNQNYLNKLYNYKTIFWTQGKIEIRKGHDILHEVFSKAFPNNEEVELWISWNNPFLKKEEIDDWEALYRAKLGDKVKFIPPIQNPCDMAQLMSQTDCGIWLSRSEGFCLPCLEYLAMGKHVIGPSNSGFTEYLNKNNSFLIEFDESEPMFDGVWFKNEESTWAHYGENQIEQAVNYLRDVHSKKQTELRLVNEAGIETGKKFTWENTAKKIYEVIK